MAVMKEMQFPLFFYSGDALDVTKSVTGTGAIIKQ